MSGLTVSQKALLGLIARDGETTVIVRSPARPRPWWRTLEALIDRGLVRDAGSRVEAYGNVTRRVYRLTAEGEAAAIRLAA